MTLPPTPVRVLNPLYSRVPEVTPAIESDASEIGYIYRAVCNVDKVPGHTLEIGVRKGGGSEVIMRALRDTHQTHKTHFGVDPYGNIPYVSHNGRVDRVDYTNNMRSEAQAKLHVIGGAYGINYVFWNLTDEAFFQAFPDGPPVYDNVERDASQFSFVLFDGPHEDNAVLREIEYFAHLQPPRGAVWVFDNPEQYNHDTLVEPVILGHGFQLQYSGWKRIYKKVA